MAAHFAESALPVGAEGAAESVSTRVDALPAELARSNPPIRHRTRTTSATKHSTGDRNASEIRGRRPVAIGVRNCFPPGSDCLQPLGQLVLVEATPQDQCGTTSVCEATATLSGTFGPGWATVGTNRVFHWHVGGRFTLPTCRSIALLACRRTGTPVSCAIKTVVGVRRRTLHWSATSDTGRATALWNYGRSATPPLKGRPPWHPRTPTQS